MIYGLEAVAHQSAQSATSQAPTEVSELTSGTNNLARMAGTVGKRAYTAIQDGT